MSRTEAVIATMLRGRRRPPACVIALLAGLLALVPGGATALASAGSSAAGPCTPRHAPCRGLGAGAVTPPQDPVGRPERYTVASADDLAITKSDASGASSDSLATPNAALTGYSGRTGYFSADGSLANPQYPTAAGRFRDPLHDRVLSFRMLKPSGSAPLRFVLGTGALDQGDPDALPSWSTPVPTGRTDDPFALAAGDLDRRIGTDENYDDEAAVAFMGADHRLDVRVVDYNATADHLAVTAAHDQLPVIGADRAGTWYPGSLNLAVGDFDHDRGNEIAAVWQDAAGFHATFLRYRNDGATRSLDVVAPDVSLPTPLSPIAGTAFVPSLVSGYADVAAGDFTGQGSDEIALGYAAAGRPANASGDLFLPFLAVFHFDAALRPQASDNSQIGLFAQVHATDPSHPTWTSRGIRIAAGLFRNDPAHGFTISRREIAYAWPDDVLTLSPTKVQVLDVAPPSTTTCTVCQLTITPQTSPLTVAGPTPFVNVPLSLAAGGFWGLPANRAPIWALAVGWTGASQSGVTFLRVGDGALAPMFTSDPADNQTHYTLTADDRQGRSLVLGAPIAFTVTHLQTPTVIAQEPPKHVDWLDGEFVNVSRNPELNVKLGSETEKTYTAKTTTKSSWDIGGSVQLKVGATVEEGLFGLEDAGLKTEVGAAVENSYQEEHANYDKSATNFTQGVQSTSADDDLVSGYFQTFYVYRYPILGRQLKDAAGTPVTGPGCASQCHGYLEIELPGSTDRFDGTPGRSLDWYQPAHENGNALSYPVLDGGHVSIPDLGSFQYKDENGHDVTKKEPLFNQSVTLGGAENEFSYDFSSSQASGFERTTTRALKESVDTTFGIHAGFNLGALKAEGEESLTTKFDNKNSWATLNEGETDTKSATSFRLDVPQIPSVFSYRIGTAYYYAADGTTKVAQGVDLTSDAEGQSWWARNYGRAPDPGLNLPEAIVMTKNDLGVFDEPKWNPLGDNSQRIRGFFVLHGGKASADAAPGAPYTTAPVEGDEVLFDVRVTNFSLVEAANVPVDFYAVPVDAQGLDVTGPPVKIGAQTIARIGPQGTVDVRQPWVASLPSGSVAQNYRIFVVVDRDNALHSIHPWKQPEDPPCPAESVLGGKPVTDPMTGKPEDLSCGQNKQGFGTVAVVAKPALEESPGGANLRLSPSSLQLAPSGALLTGGRGAPRKLAVDVPLEGIIHVDASAMTDESRPVLIYDGPPAGGHLVAATAVSGADAERGAYARFSWTPTQRGRHTLYAVLLGGQEPTQSTDTLTVVVK